MGSINRMKLIAGAILTALVLLILFAIYGVIQATLDLFEFFEG